MHERQFARSLLMITITIITIITIIIIIIFIIITIIIIIIIIPNNDNNNKFQQMLGVCGISLVLPGWLVLSVVVCMGDVQTL